jgi:hypothetical protein
MRRRDERAMLTCRLAGTGALTSESSQAGAEVDGELEVAGAGDLVERVQASIVRASMTSLGPANTPAGRTVGASDERSVSATLSAGSGYKNGGSHGNAGARSFRAGKEHRPAA